MAVSLGTTRKAVGVWMSHAARLGRAMTYIAIASTGLAVLGARVVYGGARDATVRLGTTLDRFGDLTADGNTLLLNGATVHIATDYTDAKGKDVLDRYETDCSSHPGVLGETIHEMASKNEKAHSLPSALQLGVVRENFDKGGMVVCFANDGNSAVLASSLKDRIKSFLDTHDLSVFGALRYVTVQEEAAGRTRVRTIWTEGPLRVDTMFPATGDSPGSDSRLAARPPSSRRTVAAAAREEPYGVRVYESKLSVAELRSFYDTEMPRRGFQRASSQDNAEGAAYTRDDGAMVFVAIGRGESTTSVSVVDTTGGVAAAVPSAE